MVISSNIDSDLGWHALTSISAFRDRNCTARQLVNDGNAFVVKVLEMAFDSPHGRRFLFGRHRFNLH